MKRRFTRILAAFALLVFMMPSLVAWGQTTIYSETFGDNGSSNTAYASYSGYSATTSMFVGTGTVASHYTGSGKVGKNNVDASSGYTGASGKSAAWFTAGSGNNVNNALVISGINISGYTDLVLSFGMFRTNGAASTNVTSVTYSIDGGTAQTLSITQPTSNATWTLINGNLSGTGNSLTITFTMTTTGGFTSRYDDIVVTGVGGQQVTPSDLTLTDAPVALSFDLYNNASAQTVSYTTSSTGAITITPETSDYFTYVHNASAKTITVTPRAVTPSAQTVTISQAIDGTYAAGSASFTVSVANSTPTTTVTIDNSGITNTDVYVNTEAGSLSATVTSNGNTVPGATVTWSGNNDAVATINENTGAVTLVGTGTVTFTATYAGVSGQYVGSSATYEMNVTSSAPYVQPTTIEANLNNNLFGTSYNGQASGITDTNPVVGTIDNVTVTYAGGGNHYINNSQIRFYPSNKLTFEAPEGYEITQIVFTASSWGITVKVGDVVISSETKTWTGNASEVVFTGTGSSGNCQMTKATITLAQLAPKHTLTITMSHVADYTIFIDDEIVPGPDPENPSQTVQVTEGTTVGVSIGGMENCYLFSSLTVNGLTTGVTQDDPDDLYFEFTMPEENAEIDVTTTAARSFTLTVVGMDNVSFDMSMGYNSTEVTITDGTASICEQMHVTIADLTANDGLLVQSVTVTDGAGQPVTVNQEGSAYVFNMPSSNATLTFTTVNAPTYTRASSIESGKIYIISNGDNRAMGKQNGSIRSAAAVSIEDNIATANSADVYEFEITGSATAGYTIYDVKDKGYLYASSSGSNNIGTRAENTDDNSMWAIAFNGNEVTITAKGDKTRNSLRYNSNGDRFTCYGSNVTNVDATLYLYEKSSYTLTIAKHGATTEAGGWNLIASPVAVNPANVEGMTIGISDPNYSDFDLYYFDQTGGDNGMEWKNYKANHFDLVPGKGYLYANANTVQLTFTGEMNNEFGDVDNLPYVEGNTIQSLYLAGNSKTTAETFYVYDNNLAKQTVNFLTINENGNGFTTTTAQSFTAQALQGFFVQSGGAGWTLSTADMDAKSENTELLNVMVSQNHGILADNAIVSFSNTPLLNKLYLSNNSTRVFIPQNGEEMAVVRSEGQGEMPVNFKAAENGTYTLSINAENVEMNYLHLIDNKTGNDVDLLQTPSYSFEAKTTDYESRFKLVFVANNEDSVSTGTETFAFFSNGSFVINNEGNAELQVIDITGRIVKSESINGCANVNVNAAPGVYMLRLVNGDNVKTQKVVVK